MFLTLKIDYFYDLRISASSAMGEKFRIIDQVN